MMLTDLSNGHGKSQEFPTLKAILVGDKKTNKRAQVREGVREGGATLATFTIPCSASLISCPQHLELTKVQMYGFVVTSLMWPQPVLLYVHIMGG